MSFHLDYLLDLPGVKGETCTQIEGKIYFRLSVVASGIVCPQSSVLSPQSSVLSPRGASHFCACVTKELR